mmetsp:Transcript_46202/g.85893  ORF Transcript_46202/g.85893 Transcript_46202/m.85893 type:complete len:136 (-) Transcript_46202:674-1081(-)
MSLQTLAGSIMMKLSLGLNCAILTPLTFALWSRPDSKRHEEVLGPDTQARRILFAMYTSINLLSAAALLSVESSEKKAALVAVPVFAAQIVYKTITAFYNRGWTPVIYANQFVTVVHLFTLHAMRRDGLLDLFLK